MARPSTYTPEIGTQICEKTASTSLSLHSICKELKISYDTVTGWIYNTEHEFSPKYAHAKLLQADFLIGEIIEISDNEFRDTLDGEFGPQGNPVAVNRDKLKVDTRKWAASKLFPKKYGDKLDVTTDGKALPTTINIIRDNGGRD